MKSIVNRIHHLRELDLKRARSYHDIEVATFMKSITAKQLKNRTGDVLRRVGRGEKVIVTKRGKPCALISPLGAEQAPTMGLALYEEAWKGIEKTLGSTKAHHKSWEDALRWSRRRA